VNFTGSAGSAGDTWLTRSNAGSFNAFNGTCMQADILINKFNNAKGGGLVALLQTDPGGKGLSSADRQRKHGRFDAEHDRSQ